MITSAKHKIFNQASALLGQGVIADPDDDRGRVASNLNAHLASVAEEVAQEADWPSCRARVLLVAETLPANETLPAPFTKRYPLPQDYLRLLDFDADASGFCGDHTIELDDVNNRRVMLTNFEPGWIVYARLPKLDNFDPLLRAAVGARLAQRISRTITESDSRAREVEAQAQQAFDRAIAATVFERSADRDRTGNWVNAMWAPGSMVHR